MPFLKTMSVERKSLRYKIVIAFSLMSIIPLLVLTYFVVNYVFPNIENILEITIVVMFTLWISWLGYLLIRQIITPVLDLALETKIIAEGKYGSKVSMTRGDEVSDIAEAVNTMTGKIRSYIAELQDYSKKTASLNIRIHKKVLTLTNLMRLGDLISTGAGFDEMATFAAERLCGEFDKSFCVIYMREESGDYLLKTFYNNTHRDIPAEEIAKEMTLLEKLFPKNDYLVMDARPLSKPWQKELREKLGLVNLAVLPMVEGIKIVGAMVVGSFTENYEFTEDEVGVVRAYEKEMVLGRQSSQVFEKVKSMEVVDSLTGLYTRAYLEDRVEDEINRAVFYQRPCSILLINVDDFQKYAAHHGVAKAKQVLKQMGLLLSSMASPVGKVARFDYDEFGILLPEKNKRESIEIAEDIRRRIEEMAISSDQHDKVTVSIGVGENPIDGINAKEIIAKAYHNLEKAKEKGKNQVCGE